MLWAPRQTRRERGEIEHAGGGASNFQNQTSGDPKQNGTSVIGFKWVQWKLGPKYFKFMGFDGKLRICASPLSALMQPSNENHVDEDPRTAQSTHSLS